MRKLKIIFLVLIVLSLGFKQAGNSNLIQWEEGIKLTKNDFLGWSSSKNSEVDAYTSVFYERKCFKKTDSTLTYKIACYFVKDKSWCRLGMTANLLSHEITHFNIAELFMRKLRKTILTQKYKPGFVFKTWDSLSVLEKRFDDQYDLETKSSNDLEKQREWNEKVLNELSVLKDYSNPIINLKIK